MADDNVSEVPSELLERFLSREAPTFELLRQRGDVRLWKSVTTAFETHGITRNSTTRYHITEGEELGVHHMPRLQEHALPNFELACTQRAENGAQHG